MKTAFKTLVIALVALAATGNTQAQTCNDFLGTKTLYHAPGKVAVLPPAGYRAVFVNYVGRHGARHLTKLPETEYSYRLMMKADSAHSLTEQGEKLKAMCQALQKIEKPGVKSISEEGRKELRSIAARIYAANKAVFAGKPQVTVTITKEIRTRQSADAFTGELKKLNPGIDLKELGINDTTLRFYDLSPAYTHFEDEGDWQPEMAKLEKTLNLATVNRGIAGRFFKADFVSKLSAANQSAFASGLFGFATIAYSLVTETKEAGYQPADIDFKSFFTCNELTALSAIDGADDYLKKGPSYGTEGLPVKIAAPLLADFIKTTDAAVKGDAVKANLRFSHAETISPFATFLCMAPASKKATDVLSVQKAWRAGEIIPLSANIQWVLFKNTSGGSLIQFLLNEKPVIIVGLKAVKPSYYRWADVRKFYIARLQKVGAGLNANMLSFLKEMK